MKRLVTVLVGIACVVVIAAGGLWLRQQLSPPAGQAATASPVVTGAECAGYIETLNRDAAQPGSVSATEKSAATEGRIACLDRGIN